MKHNVEKLTAWQKARSLVKGIYDATSSFPNEEKFGLTSQMRRASVSIPSNIAEGCGRRTNPDICRFLDMATGSTSELETQLFLSWDLGFLSEADFHRLRTDVLEVRSLIIGFRNSLIRGG